MPPLHTMAVGAFAGRRVVIIDKIDPRRSASDVVAFVKIFRPISETPFLPGVQKNIAFVLQRRPIHEVITPFAEQKSAPVGIFSGDKLYRKAVENDKIMYKIGDKENRHALNKKHGVSYFYPVVRINVDPLRLYFVERTVAAASRDVALRRAGMILGYTLDAIGFAVVTGRNLGAHLRHITDLRAEVILDFFSFKDASFLR